MLPAVLGSWPCAGAWRLLPGRLRNKRWGLKKWSPGGPKIDPRGGQNAFLEVFGGLLGGRWGPGGHQGRSETASGRLLGRSWRLLGPSWGRLGALLAPPGAVLGLPGRSWEPFWPPGGLFGELFGSLFGAPLENRPNLEKHCFFNCFLKFFHLPGVQHPPQIVPKSLPEASRGPLAPQEAPKSSKPRPKRGQERPKSAARAPLSNFPAFFAPQNRPPPPAGGRRELRTCIFAAFS